MWSFFSEALKLFFFFFFRGLSAYYLLFYFFTLQYCIGIAMNSVVSTDYIRKGPIDLEKYKPEQGTI